MLCGLIVGPNDLDPKDTGFDPPRPWGINCTKFHDYTTGARGTDHPLFSNFLFINSFSIKFLYFFIISSLFLYFNEQVKIRKER